MSSDPTLVYWGLNARATPLYFVAALGGVKLNWDSDTANAWPAAKGEAPFGQLPFVKDGDVTLAQSFALVRYLGRKGGVQGHDLAAYGRTEQITEEAVDLFNAINKAKYAADSLGEFTKFFDSDLPTHFGHLDKLLAHHTFFSGDQALQGDAALYGVLYIAERLSPERLHTALSAFPKLTAWKAATEALPTIAAAKAHIDSLPSYFTWPN